MSNIELTLLSKKQLKGKNKLKIFDVIGREAAVTDYAILCGAWYSDYNYVGDVRGVRGYNKKENRTGLYYTRSHEYHGQEYVMTVSFDGHLDSNAPNNRAICVRPTVLFSQIQNMCSNWMINDNGEFTVECGSFPQQSVSPQFEDELNKNLESDLLKRVDFIPIKGVNQEVFEYQGSKYARVKVKRRVKYSSIADRVELSNKKTYYHYHDYGWVKYQPLRWYVDFESGIAFTEKLIFPAKFDKSRTYNGKFKASDLYDLMNTDLLNAMNLDYSVNNVDLVNYLGIANDYLQGKITGIEETISSLYGRIDLLKNNIDKNNDLIKLYSPDNDPEKGYQKVKR